MFWHYVFGWLVSAHPLKTDESEVHIMNITAGNGTNQNNSCLILQDLYNLVHNLDPFYLPRNNCQSHIPITEICSSCRLEPFPQGRDTKAKFRGWTGTFRTAGYIGNPDLAQIMGLIRDVSDCMGEQSLMAQTLYSNILRCWAESFGSKAIQQLQSWLYWPMWLTGLMWSGSVWFGIQKIHNQFSHLDSSPLWTVRLLLQMQIRHQILKVREYKL